MTLPERYREQAMWARAQADKAAIAELKQRWLDLATQFELLAAEDDRCEKPPSASPAATGAER